MAGGRCLVLNTRGVGGGWGVCFDLQHLQHLLELVGGVGGVGKGR